ncbi:hypothetical protein GQ53DRAFT_110026 [Thozetella sp. PMI_491]|nr:hypothetical protein GQ53DRAFT_110026 [Thozetella sp. PMI_491]
MERAHLHFSLLFSLLQPICSPTWAFLHLCPHRPHSAAYPWCPTTSRGHPVSSKRPQSKHCSPIVRLGRRHLACRALGPLPIFRWGPLPNVSSPPQAESCPSLSPPKPAPGKTMRPCQPVIAPRQCPPETSVFRAHSFGVHPRHRCPGPARPAGGNRPTKTPTHVVVVILGSFLAAVRASWASNAAQQWTVRILNRGLPPKPLALDTCARR